MSPEPRIAVITGGGTGIGRAAARHLTADDWTVVVAGRRPEPLDDTVAAGEAAESVIADVADPASVESLFAGVRERSGRVDLLFNNAGTGTAPAPVEEITVEEWQRVVDVNLTGSFLCARAAIAIMKTQHPRGGRIVNNGSISAYVPRPNSAPYTATKHAITGLTKSLALDGRGFGISCGQIDIGNAETPMTDRIAEGVTQADGSIKAEPLMDVADVGRAIAYMANLPPESNVLFMTVMATEMPFVGRG